MPPTGRGPQTLACGIVHAAGARNHGRHWTPTAQTMNSPSRPDGTPSQQPRALSLEERTQALLELRRQMQELHARLEYLRLMLKLGVK
jgi:hypothetical protein